MKEGKKCFKCKKDFEEHDKVFMLGLDKPYVNLWFHLSCFSEISDTLTFLQSKTEEIKQEIPIY